MRDPATHARAVRRARCRAGLRRHPRSGDGCIGRGALMSRRAAKGDEGAHVVDPKANSGVRSTEDAR
jgi:hypothetical protein